MSDYRPPVPVKIRTARKQHICSEHLCSVPIEPGDKYELAVFPPDRDEYAPPGVWLTWKSHYPRTGPKGEHRLGCDLAGAYRENAQRGQRA